MTVLIYENLVRQFENTLLTQLRGHNNDGGILEMWVPDIDPVKSIINMVESAESAGATGFMMQVQQSTLSKLQLLELKSVLVGLADISEQYENDVLVLKFSQIGHKG